MNGAVVWLTGLPSAGKSNLARRLRAALEARQVPVVILDGDDVRAALAPPPGYDPQGRDDFYATLGNLAAQLSVQGVVVLVPATAHLARFRRRARAAVTEWHRRVFERALRAAERHGEPPPPEPPAPAFLEVYVRASEAEVRRRDRKGLYAAVREGRLSGVPGADVPFEAPESPDVVADGGRDPQALGEVLAALGAGGALAQGGDPAGW